MTFAVRSWKSATRSGRWPTSRSLSTTTYVGGARSHRDPPPPRGVRTHDTSARWWPPFSRSLLPAARQDPNPETAAKIFVIFANTDAAARAREKFEGRFFAGRRIKAVLYDDVRILAQDYSG